MIFFRSDCSKGLRPHISIGSHQSRSNGYWFFPIKVNVWPDFIYAECGVIIKNSKRMTDCFQCTSMCIFFLVIMCETHCCHFSQWLIQVKCPTVRIDYCTCQPLINFEQSKQKFSLVSSEYAGKAISPSFEKVSCEVILSSIYNHFLKPVNGDTLRGLYPYYVGFCTELRFV